MFAKIKEKEKKIKRDDQTNALVTVDDIGLSAYKKQKMVMREKNRKIQELENRMENLDSKLDLVLKLLMEGK